MDNYFFEKHFDYTGSNSINLIYCGIREKCYGHKYNKHNLDNYILTLINEGCAKFDINGKQTVLSENYFYVMHSRSEMSYIANEDMPWSISWLVMEGKQIEDILNMIGITRETPFLYIRNSRKIKSILNEIFEKTNRIDTTSKMECISLLYSLFAALSEEKSIVNNNPYIDRALKYIHEHYCEDISIQELASELGLNSNYFSKLFKKNMGMSPTVYINELKMERAKFLIKHTDMKINEICEAIGYADQFYFSRIFKKKEKISPLNYRYYK